MKTTEKFWECECVADYIKPASQGRCYKCGAYRDDQPDAIVAEVIKHGLMER